MWNFWWFWRIWWVWQSGDSGKCHVSGESGDFGDLCNIYICIGYILPTIGEYTSDECIYWYLIYSSKNWRINISWGQPAISWRASGDRQISLSASAERAFANFCDKKHRMLLLQIFATSFFTHFCNKNVFFTIFCDKKFTSVSSPGAGVNKMTNITYGLSTLAQDSFKC